ncbi:NAD(P)/FAD-dependent oxidoreductase [Maliponia aquimaris]|uniref:Hydrogen cyanide synthase subunit HcnC n=1 Tax=Maliponia aquimaris TaxID=1673631 RepID=A0A238L0E6_9RHOB|nr:FAD-binding oxidoreductase [Maliponia aquimaris]SMX48554.1 Hydrogen cyanide synthase subunit HcnC precursor [Maliponia aquimaris]
MNTAEVLVIGGGIAGISAAAELARDASVVVLEAEPQIGYHSTGRSAAVFILNYGNATLRALNQLALPELSGGLLGDTVLSPRGELLLADESALAALEAYVEGSTGLQRLTAGEACALVPVLRRDRIAAAVLEPQALDIDVDRLLQGYARLLRGRGGRIETGQRVQAIARRGGAWRVETAQGAFEAPVLVNAAGAWAEVVAEMAGVARVGLQPLRRSAVMMALPAEVDSTGWPLFASAADDWYAKPEGARLMISPADEDPVDPQDAWPDDMVLAEGLDRFSQMVDVPLVRPSHSWAGLRSFVPDRTPVVGFAPEAQGFFWLAGQGGYGVQTAPALAAITRRLVAGGGAAVDAALLAALSPARFDG